jgi:hypothetical protein
MIKGLNKLPKVPNYEDYGDCGELFKREYDLVRSVALYERLKIAIRLVERMSTLTPPLEQGLIRDAKEALPRLREGLGKDPRKKASPRGL